PITSKLLKSGVLLEIRVLCSAAQDNRWFAGVITMRPHHLFRMLLVPSLMVTGSLAGADDTPPKGQGPTPPAKPQKRPDDLDRRKRIFDELSADAKENDRLFQKMVKEDPQDVGAWLFFGWNAAYNLSVETKDPNERYAWVKRGIERFVEGLGHNPTN